MSVIDTKIFKNILPSRKTPFEPTPEIPETDTQRAIERVQAAVDAINPADVLVKTASAALSAERVVTDTSTIAVDWATAGQAKFNVVDDSVSDAKLRDSAALSLIGRSANSTGNPADIAAGSDGAIMRRSGTSIGFGNAVASSVDFVQSGTGASTRTVQDKLRETISVKDFGAVADFTYASQTGTNNATAFQNTINSVSSGGRIRIPAGYYYISSSLTLADKSITFEGDGPNNTHLIFNDCNGIVAVVDDIRERGCRFKGITFVTTANGTRTGVSYTGGTFGGIQLKKVIFEDCGWLGADRMLQLAWGANPNGNTCHWLIGADVDAADHASFINCIGVASERSFTENWPTASRMIRANNVIELDVLECEFARWEAGLEITGPTEALDLRGSSVLANRYGIIMDTTAAANFYTVIGNHFSNYEIDLDWDSANAGTPNGFSHISHNFFLKRTDATASGYRFIKIFSDFTIISNNQFAQIGGDPIAGGDVTIEIMSGSDDVEVDGNIFYVQNTCVHVHSGTSDIAITNNKTVDSGSTALVPAYVDEGFETIIAGNFGDRPSELFHGHYAAAITNKTDTAVNIALSLNSERATPTANDRVGLSFKLRDSASNLDEFARIEALGSTITSGAEGGALRFHVMSSGSLSNEMILTPVVLGPNANDGLALGNTSAAWADLFLASGGIIDWANNDVRITHSTNALAFSGASSGYSFDAVVSPATSDGAALGSTTLMWSDAFFASGAVLNFNNGDVTITHGTNTLAFAGASSGYSFDANVSSSVAGVVATLTNTTDTAITTALEVQNARPTPATNDRVGIDFKMNDSAGNKDVFARIESLAAGVTSGAESGQLRFQLVSSGSVGTEAILTTTNFSPGANDGNALGNTASGWADLFLATGGILDWGNNNARITHSTGLLTFSVPAVLPSYTVAGVPAATTAGQIAYISNETGGAVIAFTDGTNWRRVTDRTIIA